MLRTEPEDTRAAARRADRRPARSTRAQRQPQPRAVGTGSSPEDSPAETAPLGAASPAGAAATAPSRRHGPLARRPPGRDGAIGRDLASGRGVAHRRLGL